MHPYPFEQISVKPNSVGPGNELPGYPEILGRGGTQPGTGFLRLAITRPGTGSHYPEGTRVIKWSNI